MKIKRVSTSSHSTKHNSGAHLTSRRLTIIWRKVDVDITLLLQTTRVNDTQVLYSSNWFQSRARRKQKEICLYEWHPIIPAHSQLCIHMSYKKRRRRTNPMQWHSNFLIWIVNLPKLKPAAYQHLNRTNRDYTWHPHTITCKKKKGFTSFRVLCYNLKQLQSHVRTPFNHLEAEQDKKQTSLL